MGLERFPRRNIKHEAASLSTCSGLLIILTKEVHSPTLLTRGIAVSWQLGERENSCFSNLRLQGAIESSTRSSSIDRQPWHQIDLATKELPTWPSVRAFSSEVCGRMRVAMSLQTFRNVIADVWLAWGLAQTNLMYKLILYVGSSQTRLL